MHMIMISRLSPPHTLQTDANKHFNMHAGPSCSGLQQQSSVLPVPPSLSISAIPIGALVWAAKSLPSAPSYVMPGGPVDLVPPVWWPAVVLQHGHSSNSVPVRFLGTYEIAYIGEGGGGGSGR